MLLLKSVSQLTFCFLLLMCRSKIVSCINSGTSNWD